MCSILVGSPRLPLTRLGKLKYNDNAIHNNDNCNSYTDNRNNDNNSDSDNDNRNNDNCNPNNDKCYPDNNIIDVIRNNICSTVVYRRLYHGLELRRVGINIQASLSPICQV